MTVPASSDPPPTEQGPGASHLDFLLEWRESPDGESGLHSSPDEEMAWREMAPGGEAAQTGEAVPPPLPIQAEVGTPAPPRPGTGSPGLHVGDVDTTPGFAVDVPSTAPAPEVEAAETDDSPEFFEWTAERHRAIEEALSTCSGGVLPAVHRQLEEVRKALEGGQVAPDRALVLLDEIERYLVERTRDLSQQVAVAHVAVIDSRADRRRGLEAFADSLAALREYLSTGDRIHLDVAAYMADQGSASLAAARSLLMEAEPDSAAPDAQE